MYSIALPDPMTVRVFLLTRTPYETVKTALFFYVALTQTLKLCRHVRARGITNSIREPWTWVYKVRDFVKAENTENRPKDSKCYFSH